MAEPAAPDHEEAAVAIERARQHLADGPLSGDALASLAEIVERYAAVIAESRRAGQRAEATAGDTDSLTGACGGERLRELAAQELERAARFDRPLSLLMVDIDGFAALNRRHGRAAGDVVLRTLVAASLGVLRRIDSFARLDGDNFVALLPETDTTGAVVLAERLRSAVANMGVAVGDESVEFTVSIGVVSWWGPEATLEAMLGKAEAALRASGGRGNRLEIAT